MSKLGKCIVLWEKEIQYLYTDFFLEVYSLRRLKNSLVHLIQREKYKG